MSKRKFEKFLDNLRFERNLFGYEEHNAHVTAEGNKQLKRLATAAKKRKKRGTKKPPNNDEPLAELDLIDKARTVEEEDEMTIRRLTGREFSQQVPPKGVRFQAAQGQTRKEGGHRS
jgi:hypothetical protein